MKKLFYYDMYKEEMRINIKKIHIGILTSHQLHTSVDGGSVALVNVCFCYCSEIMCVLIYFICIPSNLYGVSINIIQKMNEVN